MKWTYLGLATLLQLGLSVHAVAIFDGNVIRSLGDLLAARAEPADVGLSAPLDRRQASGTCGSGAGGAVCTGNQCCSEFGYCGEGDTYCAQIAGCQPAYGWCEGQPLPSSSTPASSPTTTPTTPISPSGAPTVTVTSTVTVTVSVGPGTTVTQTVTAGTCSAGSSPGITTTPTTGPTGSTTPSAPTSTVSIPAGLQTTTNGSCGDGLTCIGFSGGECCSQFGYCGSDTVYCSPLLGCQAEYGICSASSS